MTTEPLTTSTLPEDLEPAIGIIGGSGVYGLEGMEDVQHYEVDTPFGKPSDSLISGYFEGRRIWFLARHGDGHVIAPSEVNYRANFWALRSVNVRWVICATAVGSLKEEYPPRAVVIPDQYFDRMSQRRDHTFFGEGIVAHVAFADPTSQRLRDILYEAGQAEGADIHNGGTYVCMDGPAFSTRAESEFYRSFGYDVIGMTNLPEAKLAREAEMAIASLTMVTDYDCWHTASETVTAAQVAGHLTANLRMSTKILRRAIPMIPEVPDWPEHNTLDEAIFTPRHRWPDETIAKLAPILNGR